MMPRVSVVIPTRDRRALLARALTSIEAQRFRDLEVVVVDDGSVDHTASWLRARRPAFCVIEVAQPSGAAAARNLGVQQARGEILAFLDDDDVWHPSYLEVQVAQFEAHPEADLCTTGHIEVDAIGRVSWPDLRPSYSYPEPIVHLLTECPIHTLSVAACRRKAFERVGPFDESLSIVHDLDWYLRLAAGGGKMQHNSAPLVEHATQGGLVTKYRQWFAEERAVHRRFFATSHITHRQQRWIRAWRSLFFARLGLARGDLAFGLPRLAEAFFASPLDAARIATLKLARRQRQVAGKSWDAETTEAL
jgi:glycosyltransferase involved in cell wall biosynthesis